MPHARGEKSSAWNGQAATNQTPNPSQYVLVSFHLISRAIRPLQPTPSGSLFSKIQDKTTPKGEYIFTTTHDRWKLVIDTLPPLQTKPHLGTGSIYGGIYRFESFTWIPIQILYIHGHFKLINMKLHVLMIKLTHWAWAACAVGSRINATHYYSLILLSSFVYLLLFCTIC